MQIQAISLWTPNASGPGLPVDSSDALRFAQLAQAPAQAPRLPPPEASAAAQAPTLGQAILQGMDNMRSRLDQNWASVSQMGESATTALSSRELARTQYLVMETTFQLELLGKVAAKSGQNIDTLTKMQ